MTDIRFRISNSGSGRPKRKDQINELTLSKNLSSVGSKKTFVIQTPNKEGHSTDRNYHQSKIMNQSVFLSSLDNNNPKQSLENGLGLFEQSRDSWNEATMPLTNSKDKKAMNHVYKLKAVKLKAYLNDFELKPRKNMHDSQSLKRSFIKDGKTSEDSKNISQILNQISQRELSQGSNNKAGYEYNNVPIPIEKSLFENEGFEKAKKPSTLYQKNQSSSAKEIEYVQNSQRKYYKSNDVQFPNLSNPHGKLHGNQMRRIGDLELFKINPKAYNIPKQEHIPPPKSRNQPVKIHKRGFSMDQVSGLMNTSAIQLNNVSNHSNIPKKSPEVSLSKIVPPIPNNPSNGPIDETTFFEEFFDTNKMTFNFEKVILAQRNKKKTEPQPISLNSTMNSRHTLHTRTKSIEEQPSRSTPGPNPRILSKRFSLVESKY